MSFDLPGLRAAVAARGVVVRVVIAKAAGSSPREAGAAMLVWEGGASGTIGGGALEFRAMAAARTMLAGGPSRRLQAMPLGPALGQCCGGAVTLVWERFGAASLPDALPFLRRIEGEGAPPARMTERAAGAAPRLQGGWLVEAAPPARRALWIWGAGHVGRALVGVLAPLPDFAITWVDTGAERFPESLPEGVRARIAADPVTLLPEAPETAEHLILTYSHELDLALCHGLLMRGFGGAGLIGSATKWARFRSRLQALGHRPDEIARIACPIGDPRLGKHPQAVALGVAAVLLSGERRDAARAG